MDTLNLGHADAAQDAIGLLMRHWNTIASELQRSRPDTRELHWPLRRDDTDGKARATDWAKGFVRGTQVDRHAWAELLGDEAHCGALIPMFALAHEGDPDPAVRTGPFNAEKREEIIVLMTAGLVKVYENPQAGPAPVGVRGAPRHRHCRA